MKQAAQQFQNPNLNPYVCKNFDCSNILGEDRKGGVCLECEERERKKKRVGVAVQLDLADALKGSMRQANIISPSPTATETSSQIEETSSLTVPKLTTIEQTSFDVDNSDDDKWEGDNPLNSSFIQPLSKSFLGANKEEEIPTIPSLQSSVELPPKPTHTSLPPLDTRPQSGFIPIVYVKSPTLRRPFSVATETPSTATPITGSTESVVDPAFFPKLRTEPIPLVRRGATSQRNKSGKEKQAEQGTSNLDIQNPVEGDENNENIKLQKVDEYQVFTVEDEDDNQREALEAVWSFYNDKGQEIELDESTKMNYTNSVILEPKGVEELFEEYERLENLRKRLPELDEEASEELEKIADEVVGLGDLDNRQSIMLTPEAWNEFNRLVDKESSKPGFTPQKLAKNLKKTIGQVQKRGKAIGEKLDAFVEKAETRIETGMTTFNKGVNIAGKAVQVVANPTAFNIAKEVGIAAASFVPGGGLVARGVFEGVERAKGVYDKRQEFKRTKQELEELQKKADEVVEQTTTIETEITEIKSDKDIVTDEKTQVDDNQVEKGRAGEETDIEYEDESGDDEYPQVIEMLNVITTDLKSIKKTTEELSLRDNLFYGRVMSMDARTLNFNNTLVNGVKEYQKSVENLKTCLTNEFKAINGKEGERFNAISETLRSVSSGVLNAQANFDINDNEENGSDNPLDRPFDIKKTAYNIQNEVLTVKDEVSKISDWIEKQEKDKQDIYRRDHQLEKAVLGILITGFIIIGIVNLVFYSSKKENQKAKQVNSES